MKTAKEIMNPTVSGAGGAPVRYVDAGMPVVDLLPRLLDTPDCRLGVKDGNDFLGVIDAYSMLQGLGSVIGARDDSSLVTVECRPEDFSASRLAVAVEDTDTHLVDLWTVPASEEKLRVTLRVRRLDPTPVVHSLERYGYEVVDSNGSGSPDSDDEVMRLLELNAILGL